MTIYRINARVEMPDDGGMKLLLRLFWRLSPRLDPKALAQGEWDFSQGVFP